MSENVASLSCGVPHPDLGWPCVRRRNHTADHMASDDQGERHTWTPGTDHGTFTLELDERSESIDTPGTFEGASLETIPDPPGYTPLNAWWLSLLVVFWLCAPALVLLVWRVALR